ncbi:hypothetical protein MLD38_030527 [Melastoma candidum]|uniref:Uncharacterized protein n=1 Tax=Melastoma candidum TaxID=119954 RepID=A0ACB9MM00_9MYRT|nr:hypothetical protein MLD38_030527 [Melastoma candidum]
MLSDFMTAILDEFDNVPLDTELKPPPPNFSEKFFVAAGTSLYANAINVPFMAFVLVDLLVRAQSPKSAIFTRATAPATDPLTIAATFSLLLGFKYEVLPRGLEGEQTDRGVVSILPGCQESGPVRPLVDPQLCSWEPRVRRVVKLCHRGALVDEEFDPDLIIRLPSSPRTATTSPEEPVRWDITEIDKFPPVIRSTFLGLYNSTNDITYQFMRDRGINALPFLKKMWEINCTGYLHEARLYNSGSAALAYEEYMDMSTNSIGGFVMSLTYFLEMAKSLDKETMGFVCDIPPILYNSCKVVRLTNDLGTSSYELARGDNFKAVQCYQKQHGVSEEEAHEAIWAMMEETWKDLNQQEFEEYPSFVTKEFLHACMGFARASHFFYQHGDGHALSDKEAKDYLMSLLVPVPV